MVPEQAVEVEVESDASVLGGGRAAVRNGRILLVDQDRELRGTLASYLRTAGFEVVEAEGEEAFARLDEAPEIVVADTEMPGVDAHELCRQVRAREGRDFPFIVCSARQQADDRIRALRFGADDYLVKPIVLEELLLRVRAQIARARRVRALGATGITGAFLSGRLELFSVAEVLQMLELRGRGELAVHLETPEGEQATLYLLDRVLLHAEMGWLPGPKAFCRAIGWERGTFRVEYAECPGNPSMVVKLDEALLQSLVHLDERRRLWESLRISGDRFRVPSGAALPAMPQDPRAVQLLGLADAHRGLQAIVDHSQLSDLETLRLLGELLESGALVREDPS